MQENVDRRKCTECKEGTFSMQIDNPKGCTKCFCFGRSDQCEQAPYMWTEVRFMFHAEQNVKRGGAVSDESNFDFEIEDKNTGPRSANVGTIN